MRPRRRKQIDALLQQRNIVDAQIEEMDEDGRFTSVAVRRRVSNPFETLYKAGTLDGEDRAAVYDLAGMYARSKGLNWRQDEALGVVVQATPDPHTEALRRARYGVAFGEVLARLDPWPGLVLRALIADFVEGDGARGDGDGVRWRGVVRDMAQLWNRRWAMAAAGENTNGVSGARVDVRESEAGRVLARALRMASSGFAAKDVRSLGEVVDEVRRWARDARPDMVRYFY